MLHTEIDPTREKVLLCIDWQKGFKNSNSKKILNQMHKVAYGYKWDKIIQTMWFNTMDEGNLYIKNLNYNECQVEGKDAGLIKLFPKAIVLPRVKMYSCITPDMTAILKYNMDIYITGLETDACVLGTCFSLFDLGIQFKVVTDCVATKNDELDLMAKKIMERQFGKCIFCTSDEIDVEKKKGLFGKSLI